MGVKDLAGSQDEAELSAWMRASQDGDQEAYGRLLKRLQELLTVYVRASFRRGGLDGQVETEDLVQEILLTIHHYRSNYDPQRYFLPWFYSIARHKVIDSLRRQKVHRRLVDIEEYHLDEVLAVQDVESSASQDLKSLGSRLPAKQWEVLRLVKLEELSIQEVAEQTGYSASDVKVTIHRAIKNLKKFVREDSL
ncbi:MAG: sigma-70 family RNA polymerase sigma factor [Bdellovibrionales bacterium]